MISTELLNTRRENLSKLLKSDSLVLFSQPEAYRNSDVMHSYRQDSFMYYLSGCLEPSSVFVSCLDENKKRKAVLFVRKKDKVSEMWDGGRIGVDDAKDTFSVDETYAIEKLEEKLPELLRYSDQLYHAFGHSQLNDQIIIKTLSQVERFQKRTKNYRMSVLDPRKLSNTVRLKKDKYEQECMRKAAKITTTAFNYVMENVRAGISEKEIYSMILAEFYRNGADMEAYKSIVAGGERACVLHYVDNDKIIQENEMVLIDAGAQYNYYASDVTRTFPVSGQMLPNQKEIYDLVLSAQMKAIDICRPGIKYSKIHETSVEVLTQGLIDLSILTGSLEENIKNENYKPYYPHGTGHWLGMDVHDDGFYVDDSMNSIELEAGMVFTVEPGLYFPSDSENSASKNYQGIGVRIEDDILITENGHDVLTEGIKK